MKGPSGGQGARGAGVAGLKVSFIPLGEQPTRVEILGEGQGRGDMSINFIFRIDSIGVTYPVSLNSCFRNYFSFVVEKVNA